MSIYLGLTQGLTIMASHTDIDPNLHIYLKVQGEYHTLTESKCPAAAKRTNATGMHQVVALLRAMEICEGILMRVRCKLDHNYS